MSLKLARSPVSANSRQLPIGQVQFTGKLLIRFYALTGQILLTGHTFFLVLRADWSKSFYRNILSTRCRRLRGYGKRWQTVSFTLMTVERHLAEKLGGTMRRDGHRRWRKAPHRQSNRRYWRSQMQLGIFSGIFCQPGAPYVFRHRAGPVPRRGPGRPLPAQGYRIRWPERIQTRGTCGVVHANNQKKVTITPKQFYRVSI